MNIEFEVEGIAAVTAYLRILASEMPQKAGAALYVEAELIMSRAKEEFVPRDLGTLVGSGHVDRPVIDDEGISVQLNFGGPAAPYALAIHEHPSEHDPPSWQGKVIEFQPDGRGPKYLEKPMMEAIDGMDLRLARAMGL